MKKEEKKEEEVPKIGNPLDSLPLSSFNLFDFKTEFVNSTDKKETMKSFWDRLDC